MFIILLYSAIAENSRAGTSPALASLNHILNRNDKSEHTTHLDNVVRIIIVWSEWRDLNSRPLDPQSSALPAALHPDADVRFTQLDYITTRHQKKQVLFSKKCIFLFRHLPGKRGFPKRKDIPVDVFSFGGDTRI